MTALRRRWETWLAPAPANPDVAPPPLRAVLQALSGPPLSAPELAAHLGSSPAALEGMLLTLERGGYLQQAVPQTPGCQCGPCALKSLCRSAETPAGPGAVGDAAALAARLPLLRLTERGRRYLVGTPEQPAP